VLFQSWKSKYAEKCCSKVGIEKTQKSVVPKLEHQKMQKGVVPKLEQQRRRKVLFQSWNRKDVEKYCSKVGTEKTQKIVVPKLEQQTNREKTQKIKSVIIFTVFTKRNNFLQK